MNWNFNNSYAQLPELLYAKLLPVAVRNPRMVIFNFALAESLGLCPCTPEANETVAVLAGNQVPAGANPLAQTYAGHQFGHFTMLGDGRAILLGEHITPGGLRYDVQLKGSGQTPFSRRGDGRATLGPMLREYIISEAMHALGIPTTRSLAVVTTGELVLREEQLPGAVLTRIAASHIRVGTFQYLASHGNIDILRLFVDYTIRRHYPELIEATNPYLSLLYAVVERQAELIAKWLSVGFIHGVMNTDNMAISGETIDYGPCAFMDTYDPAIVFSSIDIQGRYAYHNQPSMAQWNLARFTETLLPLLHKQQNEALRMAEAAVALFATRFQYHWLSGMCSKLGIFSTKAEDSALVTELLQYMANQRTDYTNTFRALSFHDTYATAILDNNFIEWQRRWQLRLAQQAEPLEAAYQLMQANNPAVIPRNHRVEEALEAAVVHNDTSLVQQLLHVVSKPYNDTLENAGYRLPPQPSSQPYQTFCGT